MFLFDVPMFGGLGAFIAVAFFFVVVASGVFAYIMLRKTLKMAFRMAIVAAVLLIAVFGTIALWWFLTSPSPRPRITPPPRQTNSQTR